MIRSIIKEPILFNKVFANILKDSNSNSKIQSHFINISVRYANSLTKTHRDEFIVKLGTNWQMNFIRNFASLPPHTRVNLPALSPTMESGTIASWDKKEGDQLKEGDMLAQIETDKATMGFETPEEGYLAKIVVPAGQKDVKVGKLVCIIVENEGDVAAFKGFKDDGSVASPAAAPAPVAAAPATVAAAPAPTTAPSAASNFPSHTKVNLPALSPTMESGTIASWDKKEGDQLKEGDMLAQIETDKATMGFETPEEGYLAKIVVPAGQKDVKVGKLVCIIVENEGDVAAFKDFKDDGSVASPAAAPAPVAPAPATVAAAPAPTTAPSAASNFPSHTKVNLPALSPTMESGTIASWDKKEGDQLKEGDMLAQIETDKATMGFETPEEGYLAKIVVPAGQKDVKVGKLVCIIVSEEKDIAAFKDYKDDGSAASTSAPAPAVAPSSAAAAPSPGPAPSNLPPHTPVPLPALSPTMETGTIASWEKKEGDELKEGDMLAQIETDKATMGFETPEEGYLAKIVVPAGQKDVKIGKIVCIIVPNKEDIAAFKDYKEGSGAPAAISTGAPSSSPAPSCKISSGPAVASGGGKRPSPMGKRILELRKARLGGIAPKAATPKAAAARSSPAKGPAPAGKPTSGGYKDIPVSGIRATIAKRLLESKTQSPHYYLNVHCKADKLLEFREKINNQNKGARVSVNDLVIKAVALACKSKPEANAYWMGNIIRQFHHVDVSVAVSTPTGLITPIVFKADVKSIFDISKDVKDLAKKARENKLKPEEFQGGTVTVSNLGMYGINNFCAVINPPQSLILAVGKNYKKLVKDCNEDKGFREANMMEVFLSADHRTIDGAVAAEWLMYFRGFIESPEKLMSKK